ncbi:sensor histidine kinase [Lunatibacter salilacus]|uniref:sensor histidine kinase n=1 Tax=Lunatibacter salilacus TaxID=2483804 RepID=UPI00131B83C3|nr:histidine kinase [Lunatibacter salilacus]
MEIKEPYDRYLMMLGLSLLSSVFISDGPFLDVVGVTLLFTFAYWEGNYQIVSFARIKFPLFEDSQKRIRIQGGMALIYTVSVGLLLGFLLKWFDLAPERPDYYKSLVIQGLIITAIISMIYETVYYFQLWKESLLESERLKKNQARLQFESLKNQVNPHFLFNSLNTLSALIPVDPVRAERFVQEFAKNYRYVLEVKDKSFVPLEVELEFVRSYCYLQKIRFEDQLIISEDIDSSGKSYYIPPLILQNLVENAIKHNSISEKHPLHIQIQLVGDILQVKNRIQARQGIVDSTKTGLKNIRERMKLVSNRVPEFYEKDGYFFAEIPLVLGE